MTNEDLYNLFWNCNVALESGDKEALDNYLHIWKQEIGEHAPNPPSKAYNILLKAREDYLETKNPHYRD